MCTRYFFARFRYGALVAAALSSSALADAVDLYNLPLNELVRIPVTTGTRAEAPLQQVPATVYVISAADIQRYGYTSLADALTQVPGVQIINPDFFAVGGQRGFLGNFSQSLLLVNGREMQNLIAAEAFISHQFATHNIARIEILNGPGSVLYGANALTGVINIITREDDTGFNAVRVAAEAGSQQTRAVDLTFGKQLGAVRLSGSVRQQASDGWDHADALRDSTLSNGAPAILQETSARHAGTYHNHHRAMPYDIKLAWEGFYAGRNAYHLASAKGLENLALRYDRQIDERRFQVDYVGWQRPLFDGVQLKLERQHYEETFWGRNHNFDAETYEALTAAGRPVDAPLSLDDIEEAFTLVYSQRGSRGSQLDRSLAELQWKQPSFTLTSGLEYTEKDIYGVALAFEDRIPPFDESVSPANPLRRPTYQSELRSAYAQIETPLNEAVILTLGSRWDDQSFYGSIQTWRSGVVWNATDATTLKLLYGEAFREPTIFELGPSEDTATQLKPSRMESWEAALLHKLSPELHAQLTLFESKATDLIVPGSTVDFVNSSQSQINRGIEHLLQWQANPWRGDLAYAYTDPENQRVNGESVDALNVYRHRISSGLSYPLTEAWTLAARVNYFDGLDAEHGNSGVNEVITIDHAVVVDLTASWRLPLADDELLQAYVTLRNATDTQWEQPNVRNTGPQVFPQAGRTVLGRVSWEF